MRESVFLTPTASSRQVKGPISANLSVPLDFAPVEALATPPVVTSSS
jgi:hypothetical protein